MKNNDKSISLIMGMVTFLLCATSQAGQPVWTFIPTTATTIQVPSNGARTVQYQITNQSKKNHTLLLKSVTGIAQTTTGAGICTSPFTLSSKQSCLLTLVVNGRQLQGNVSGGPIVCQQGPDGNPSRFDCYQPDRADSLNVQIVPSSMPLVAVGNYTNARVSLVKSPLIALSTDLGATWSATQSPPSQFNGFLQSASCTGSNAIGSICNAVGEYKPPPSIASFPNQPLVASSTFDGTQWSAWVTQTIQVLYGGYFNSTSCTGSGIGSLCFAVGQHFAVPAANAQPLVAYSTYDGTQWGAWALFNIDTPSAGGGIFNAVSCSGTGADAVCFAAGQDYGNHQPLVSLLGIASGELVSSSVDIPVTGGGNFNATSCTGNGTDAVCFAAGQDYTNNQPLLAYHVADTLFYVDTPTSGGGNLNAVSCTGSGVDAICFAAGQDFTNNQPLMVSGTAASSWTFELSDLGTPGGGNFSAASCTGSGTNTACVAVGEDFTSNLPLIAIGRAFSTEYSWFWVDVGTATGTFNSASCSGSGADVACFAAGVNYNTSNQAQPLVAYSTGASLNTWTQGEITGLFSDSHSYFRGGSGPGSSSHSLRYKQHMKPLEKASPNEGYDVHPLTNIHCTDYSKVTSDSWLKRLNQLCPEKPVTGQS